MHMDGYNFTKRMQGTLWDAVGQAQALNHQYIGTEHLLLALLASGETCGAIVLRRLGVDLQATRHRVLAVIKPGIGSRDPSSGSLLPFSSRSKIVLGLAKEEAHALKHDLIGTEDLLLGMIAEGKGVAAQLLAEAGVDLERARSEVVATRRTTSDDERGGTPAAPGREQPTLVRVELEYMNGAVVSKHFTTAREAAAFLEGEGRV